MARRLERLIHFVAGPAPITHLDKADVYHSPHWAIPEQVRRSKRVQRFLTVYDLTPILFPHFFAYSEEKVMRETIAQIGPDDWVFAVSESTKRDLCNHAPIDPERVFVIPLSADRERFYPCPDPERQRAVRAQYGVPEAPYLLSLCTLQPRKNLEHLIRCFNRLVREEKLADLHLVLAGAKGWKEGPIFDAIQELGPLKERVVVTGFVADEDLAPLYSGALAFAYPSFYEGFGLPPLEAMQCGIPVLSSNTSSLPEVIGDAGILLAPTDLDGWCQAMRDLYADSALRAALREKALAQSVQFSWERCAMLTVEGYQTAVTGSKPSLATAGEAARGESAIPRDRRPLGVSAAFRSSDGTRRMERSTRGQSSPPDIRRGPHM